MSASSPEKRGRGRPRKIRSTTFTGQLRYGSRGGQPCSDCHHAPLYLPDGQPYEEQHMKCCHCGQFCGYHHRGGHCPESDPPPDGSEQRYARKVLFTMGSEPDAEDL